MKIAASDIIGLALDWAAALSIGYDESWLLRQIQNPNPDTRAIPHVSTSWAEGGPLIDMKKIDVRYDHEWEMSQDEDDKNERWFAQFTEESAAPQARVYGATALIAAMRCFVVSQIGETVEIPDELL